MKKYVMDKAGDVIYTGMRLPEHTGDFVRKCGGHAKYHEWLMEQDIAAPVYTLINGKSEICGLRIRFPSKVQIGAANISVRKPIVVKPKVSRNSPCPCGSGKKYKKCCINKK